MGSRECRVTDARGQRTNYQYAADDNVAQVTYTDTAGNALVPPTPTVTYTYDPNFDRIRQMHDGTGDTVYGYKPITNTPTPGAGKLETVTGPLANSAISYSYDKLGRALSYAVNGVGSAVDYDALGRLTTTDNPLGHFSRTYDGVTQRLGALNYPAATGVVATYSYYGGTSDRRLQTLQNSGAGGANISRFDYSYDSEGEIKTWTKTLGTTVTPLWFDYDNADQLLSAHNTQNPASSSYIYDFGYDPAGNRSFDYLHNALGAPDNGTDRTYTITNPVNQFDSVLKAQNGILQQDQAFAYDAAGNMTSDQSAAKSYEWDAASRLTAINYTGTSNRSEFSYDGLSRRVKIVEKSGSTINSTKQFVWSGNEIVEERSGTNAVTRRYFAEGEQRTTTRETRTGTETTVTPYYYTRDHLGSVREALRNTGAVVAQYDYDPNGVRTQLNGAFDFDFGYTGHYFHAPSGLNLALYRAYSPTLGRWLSRDPVAEYDGANLYRYVYNDPVDATDPLGLYATANAAAEAGARADLLAASGNKLLIGAVEYAGWVCERSCAPPQDRFYYTGPTRGRKGSGGNAPNASTSTHTKDLTPCNSGDKTIGFHYAHPDGSLIPPWDRSQSDQMGKPFMVAAPSRSQSGKVIVSGYGTW